MVYIYIFSIRYSKIPTCLIFFLGAQHRWQLPGSYARGRSRKAGNTKGCQFLMIFLCFPMYLTAWLWLELSTLIFLSVLVTVWLTDWFECLFLYACLVLLSVYIFVSLTVTGCLLWCSLSFYLNVFICLFILQGPRLKLLYAMRGKADKVILEPSEFHRKITLTFKAQSIVLQCPGTLGTIGCILLKANVRNKSQGLYCL